MDIIEIRDFQDPRLDVYARLNEPQLKHYFEPFGGIFIAESPKVVLRALEKGCQPLSLLIDEKQVDDDTRIVLEKCQNIPAFSGPPEVIRSLTGIPMTRGLLCCMKRPDLPDLETLCSSLHRIVILENVTNPTNVGAIFRSAAALGMEAVLLDHASTDPYYRRASRVAMGTVFQIPWTRLEKRKTEEDLHYADLLHQMGFKLAAMALTERAAPIDDPLLLQEEKLAVILGNEGEGLPKETLDKCDYTVIIPMENGVDSLNVAAASAVAFWQLGLRNRQRQ